MSNRHTSAHGKRKSNPIEHVFRMAGRGSVPHIAMIAGAVIVLALLIFGIAKLAGGSKGGKDPDSDAEINEMDLIYDKDREAIDSEQLGATILEYTPDAGQEYVDGTLFIGDSNTVRTMLYGHTTWDNVVATESMGIQHIESLKLAYFKGYSEPVTVIDAVKIIQPKRIIITYGTNNLLSYSGAEFARAYKKKIDKIHEAYPYADIIINAIPPIDRQRENLALTMQKVDEFNKAVAEMADEAGYKFLNSSEALKDPTSGFAKANYTIGDGVHLSKLGMEALFSYIRTHAYETADRRPKPLKAVPQRLETPTGIISEDPIAVRGTRIKVRFVSSDPELGSVDGEVEQKIKRTIRSSAVTAKPNTRAGAVFTGWTCNYDGLSSTENETVTFTVPQVPDDVTEIVITAHFEMTALSISCDGKKRTDLEMKKGEELQLYAETSGKMNGDVDIKWETDDRSIALVDRTGRLTAVNGGSTTVYASMLNGKIYASCKVTVKVELESISISGNTSLEVGQKTNLKLTASPQGTDADVSKAKWSSADESVAKVDSSGKVTAVGQGKTVIYAELEGKKAEIGISVTKRIPLESISISGETEMYEGETSQLYVSFYPEDTTDLKLTAWTSSDNSVATVSEGKVFGMSEGTAIITCTVGSVNASVKVTIKAEAQVTPPPAPSEPEEPPVASQPVEPPVTSEPVEPPEDPSSERPREPPADGGGQEPGEGDGNGGDGR